jgi:hypothetical protein
MTRKPNPLGYGFSEAAVEDAWRNLERDRLPKKTPDCPLTGGHVAPTPSPTPRRRLADFVGAQLQQIRLGEARLMEDRRWAAAGLEIPLYVSFPPVASPDGRNGLHVQLLCQPVPATTSRHTTDLWSVAVRLPLLPKEGEPLNTKDDLCSLDQRRLRLDFWPKDQSWSRHLETQLYWNPDQTALVSHPDEVSIPDPKQIEVVGWWPGERVPGYQ